MILLLIALITVLFIVLSWLNMIKDTKHLNVNGPFPLPVVGNAYLFMLNPSDILDTLQRLSIKYGDAFRFHLFSNSFVALSHPKYLEPLLSSSKLTVKGDSVNLLLPWLGQGLVTASGPHWKSHRKILTPAFHYNILQNFLPVFCKNHKLLEEELLGLADGTPVEVYRSVALNILCNVTECMMGVSLDEQKQSLTEYMNTVEEAARIMSLRLRMPLLRSDAIFNLLPYKTTHDRAIKYLHEYTNKVIFARRKQLKEANITSFDGNQDTGIKNKHAFLDLLLLSNIDGKPIEDESVREEVDTFMFANDASLYSICGLRSRTHIAADQGHDTTSTTICNALYCLSKRRDVQEKIFEEQKQIFADDLHRDPTYAELQQMKYLELVIKETMRLYPAISLTERKITEDSDLGGVKVTKGTLVWINIFQCHRHPDLFDDPLEFRPERFEEPLKHPFSWLGFSAGPRNCIGQKFALMAIKVTLAATIKKFIVLPTEQVPKFDMDNITLKPVNGVHVRFLPRS